MNSKVNTTVIGLFIVTGVVLGVAGVLLFSSARFFSKTREIIVYFDDSLNGLSEGAPVKYRGVTVGSVKRVMVHYNQATNDYAMPVLLEFREELIRERMGDHSDILEPGALERRIEGGLRASLQTESLVTGVLYIEVRPNPNAPPPRFHQLTRVYTEIPSEPTSIQQMFSNLAQLDIKGIGSNINHLIVKLDQAVGNLQIVQINHGLTNLLASLDRLVNSRDLSNSLASVQSTLEQYRELADKLGQRIDPVAQDLSRTLNQANLTLAQMNGAAENLRGFLSPDAPFRGDLERALQELGYASHSLASLLDFLKQHPNALITGRQPKETKP